MTEGTPRPRVSRRRFIQLGALTAIASTSAILVSCAGPAATPTTASAPATAAPAVAATATKPAAASTTASAAPTATTAAGAPTAAATAAAGAPTAAAGTPTAAATAAAKPTTAAAVTPASEVAGIVSPKAARGELAEQTIVLAISSGPEADAHRQRADQFKAYTKGKVTLQIEEVPRGTTGTAKVLATMQGKSSAWDVVNFTTLQVPQYCKAGFFAPLKTFQADTNLFDAKAFNAEDWPASLLKIHQYNGDQYAYPQEASTLMFFYRTDLLQKYGVTPPGPNGYSWKELAANCLILKDKLKADGQTDVYPLVFGVKPTGHASINGYQPMWSYGQELFDDKWNPTFSGDKGVAGLTMMTNFLFKDAVVSPGVVGYEYAEVLTAYQQGKCVMALEWNAAAPTILDPKASPITATTTAFSVYPYDDVAGPTQNRVYPSVWAQGVSAYSTKKEAAFAYITWWTSKEIAKQYVSGGGGSSGRASLLADPAIVAKNPQYPSMLNGFKVYHSTPAIAEFSYIDADIVNPDIGGIWSKQSSVKDGLAKVDKEALAYLKDQGVVK